MKQLNKQIIDYLSKKLEKTPGTIQKDISILKGKHGSCTSNAVAQIYAQKHGLSVLKKLDVEDKTSLPHIDTKVITIEQKKVKPKEKIIPFIDYITTDYFIMEHITEVNNAYSRGCYTCANILVRKIIENLIIDILRKKYPQQNLQNKQLYYDTIQHRYLDFSVILDNLHNKREDFDIDSKKIIERLVPQAKKIKNDANDKTHSWFFIVKSKKELDDLDIKTTIELIKKLEIAVGLRTEEK